MHTLEDTIEALVARAPAPLEAPLRALSQPPDDHWSSTPLGDLPGYATDALGADVPRACLDQFRHAHQLGLLFGWLSELPEDPAEDPRLRGLVLGSWKARLAEAAGLEPGQVADRVVHAMRWMRWGLSNESMAMRSDRWTLPEFHRCLRWKAAGRGISTTLFLRRYGPGKTAAFERTYEQLVLGLVQTTVGRHSALPRLLGCGDEELHRSGLVAMEMAQIEARAAGLDRLAEYCRDYAREPKDPRTSEVRWKKTTSPDTPAHLQRARKQS